MRVRPRLMSVSPNGAVRPIVVSNSVDYLLRVGRKARALRGRMWVEVSAEPAVMVERTPHRMVAARFHA